MWDEDSLCWRSTAFTRQPFPGQGRYAPGPRTKFPEMFQFRRAWHFHRKRRPDFQPLLTVLLFDRWPSRVRRFLRRARP